MEGSADYLAVRFGNGSAAVGGQFYYHSDSDTYRNDQGIEGGSFSNSELLGGLGCAANMGEWSIGFNAKMLGQALAGKADDNSFMMDLGIGSQPLPYIQVGAVVRNLGSAPHTEGFEVPSQTLCELSAREILGLDGQLVLYQDVRAIFPQMYGQSTPSAEVLNYKTTGEPFHLALGAGAEYLIGDGDMGLALRLGYAYDAGSPPIPFGIGTGFGVRWNGGQLDFAYSFLGELGSSQRVGLSWNLAAEDPAEPVRPLKSSAAVDGSQIAVLERRLQEGDGDKGELHLQLGQAFTAHGDQVAALVHFKESARAGNAEGAVAAGDLLWAKGKKNEATRYYRMAEGLDKGGDANGR
jgi:hypothetical protein